MTETQTVDLAAFLTAIWDEEERREREQTYIEFTSAFEQVNYKGNPLTLARIAADRKILELHTGGHECPELRTGTYPDDWPENVSWGQPGGMWKHTAVERYEDGEYCPTARLLASPYKGREGWQESWE